MIKIIIIPARNRANLLANKLDVVDIKRSCFDMYTILEFAKFTCR
jgi:hypothetical protein